MRFEWNAEKNLSNLQKHGVDFETATHIFDDPRYVMEQDREVDGEERWQTIGRANGVWLLLVVILFWISTGKQRICSSGLFQRGEPPLARGDAMKPTPIKGRPGMVEYRRVPGTPLTAEQIAQLEKLAKRPDSEIDTSDIPEWTDEQWNRAVRGRLYRPMKQAVSLRLDADVIAWLKQDGEGYQTRANRMLRELMLEDLEKRS